MSLAMYASEFNNDENNNPIQKKRENMRNKTLKRRENTKSNTKIESMLNRIHKTDEEEDDLHNYQPLEPPHSAGTERLEQGNNSNMEQHMEQDGGMGQGMGQGMEHGMQERMDSQQNLAHHTSPQNVQEAFSQLPSEYAKQYYQQYVPYFNQSSDDTTPNGVNKDELLTKLNQIIYLLEEQQDEKTGHVTEELILYSFLGIFIIFIVDSFARVGKYVR